MDLITVRQDNIPNASPKSIPGVLRIVRAMPICLSPKTRSSHLENKAHADRPKATNPNSHRVAGWSDALPSTDMLDECNTEPPSLSLVSEISDQAVSPDEDDVELGPARPLRSSKDLDYSREHDSPDPASGARIGVLVVAYNAQSTLEATLNRIPPAFRAHIAEIIIADDASQDDTLGAALRWRSANMDTSTTVIRHLANRGYGGNQKAGYRIAMERGLDVVVLLHADGQYAPECMPQMVQPILNGKADAVFGSRIMVPGAARSGGMPAYKYVGNRILSRFENLLLGTSLSEFHSGYRAYAVRALAEVPFEENTDAFDFDTQIIVQLVDAGKRILEIPIPTYYGDEICYVNGMKYAKDVVRDVLQYRTSKMGFGTAKWVPSATEYDFKQEAGSSHDLILELLRGTPPGKVLDVGCSSGLLSSRIRQLGHHVVGVDCVEEPGVRDRVDEFVQADLEKGLPDIGGEYDIVIAADIIEHVRKPETLLADMAQKLTAGGRLLVSTPNFGHWYPRARVVSGTFDYDRRGILDETHLRFFTSRGLSRTFAAAHLTVESLRYTGLPLGVIDTGVARRVSQGLKRIDRLLVRARPTLFGYQFVAVLRARDFDSVSHPTTHPPATLSPNLLTAG